MSHQVFSHSRRVTYADCTVGNHVYYGRYLNLLEEVRGEFFRSIGASFLSLQEADTLFPVIECRVRYKAAARYDDLLVIELWLNELDRLRVGFGYRVRRDTVTLIEASTSHVCATSGDKPKRMSPDLLEKLRPYLAATGDKATGSE